MKQWKRPGLRVAASCVMELGPIKLAKRILGMYVPKEQTTFSILSYFFLVLANTTGTLFALFLYLSLLTPMLQLQ